MKNKEALGALEAINQRLRAIDGSYDWSLEIQDIHTALAQPEQGSKCNLCHKDMINLYDACAMIRYLLPLAKGYVYANPGIRSTECIIEDAEAMIATTE